MIVEKPKLNQLLRPITTGTNSAMNQSQFLAITCNSLEAREKSRVHGAIGFGFQVSHDHRSYERNLSFGLWNLSFEFKFWTLEFKF